MIGYACNNLVADDQLRDFLLDMAPAGQWEQVEESLMDTVAALSVSGPAYTYYFAEALCQGAVQCGMDPQQALAYTIKTLEGAVALLKLGDKSPEQLRREVCSPGGSTIAGVRVLEDKSFRSAAMECVVAAYNKNKELGK